MTHQIRGVVNPISSQINSITSTISSVRTSVVSVRDSIFPIEEQVYPQFSSRLVLNSSSRTGFIVFYCLAYAVIVLAVIGAFARKPLAVGCALPFASILTLVAWLILGALLAVSRAAGYACAVMPAPDSSSLLSS
jgi:hypothetical protein